MISSIRNNKLLKTIAYLWTRFLIAAAFIVTGCSQNGQFNLLDGKTYSLDDFKGRWLVVNFWAEWCAPCLDEIPELNRLAKEGANDGISVIGVSFDAMDNDKLKSIVAKWQFEYPVMATEPVPLLPFSLPTQLPTNYIINPGGEIVNQLVGQQDYESLRNALSKAKNLER